MKLNDNEQAVLREMAERTPYDNDYGDGGYFYYFATIMEWTGLDRAHVRRACRSLTRKGLCEYHKGLWTEDGEPAGAGYCITRAGLSHRL